MCGDVLATSYRLIEMRICVGGLWFPTKTEAKNVIRRILQSLVGQDVRSHFIVIEKLSGMGIRAVIDDNSYVDLCESRYLGILSRIAQNLRAR